MAEASGKGPAVPLRLLAVFPHPDDESLGMGAAFAKYSAEGVETFLLMRHAGERGWTGPEDENPGLRALRSNPRRGVALCSFMPGPSRGHFPRLSRRRRRPS